jgi:hypothetical protein
MIDLGRIPRTIQSAVGSVCREVEIDLGFIADEMLIDEAGEMETLLQWATTLGILFEGEDRDKEWLRAEIKSRLNATGSVNVDFFYELAKTLGFKPFKDERNDIRPVFEPNNQNVAYLPPGGEESEEHPKINITDGHFLPCRAGISKVGDNAVKNVVYDNKRYGATTVCVIFDEVADETKNALISLMMLAKNMGTVMLFYEEKRFLG